MTKYKANSAFQCPQRKMGKTLYKGHETNVITNPAHSFPSFLLCWKPKGITYLWQTQRTVRSTHWAAVKTHSLFMRCDPKDLSVPPLPVFTCLCLRVCQRAGGADRFCITAPKLRGCECGEFFPATLLSGKQTVQSGRMVGWVLEMRSCHHSRHVTLQIKLHTHSRQWESGSLGKVVD